MNNLQSTLNKDWAKELSKETTFFFQHGQDALKAWLQMDLNDATKQLLSNLSNDYVRLQEEAKTNQDLNRVLKLLFEIISYCDTKAKDKKKYNRYKPNRVLAEAAVRMNNWVEKLINFKLSPTSVQEGSPKNAFNYLLDPQKSATILSLNHRKLVCENLFEKPYIAEAFVDELKSYFSKYNLTTLDADNYTHFLSRIVYDLEDEWKEEVVGLMASDGTGWQDDHIKSRNNHVSSIIWNSKSPTGGNVILEQLKKVIEDKGYFNFYYCSGGNVNYKATIIDFAKGADEYKKKKWSSKNALYFQSDFNQYSDKNKSAKIVFLVDSFEKVNPIPVSSFKFYKASSPIHDNISPLRSEPITPQKTESSQELINSSQTTPHQKFMDSPLNQILYGPPGTGKTYHTINRALEICGEATKGKSRKKLKALFDEKVATGQIVFTTFHQSMSYEDFIEGIKPETLDGTVTYTVKPGIFKEICSTARIPNQIDFNDAYENLRKDLSEMDDQQLELKTPTGKGFSVSLNSNGNLSLFTGADRKQQGVLTKENLQKHINGEPKFIGWEGYFLGLINHLKAKYQYNSEVATTPKKFVLIIDEINRGNVSQIFGELITLIEEDKRLCREEALEVTLPYSKEKFGVPSNLYILGTMNTADRSVEALDTALRRRFSFIEMPPQEDLLDSHLMLWRLWEKHAGSEWNNPLWIEEEKNLLQFLDGHILNSEAYKELEALPHEEASDKNVFKGIVEFKGINLKILLKTINQRIQKLLDKDHLIGHSFFMGVNNLSGLKAVFQNKINPLLQEYFFGDFGKIGLVLGKGFFQKDELQDQDPDALFADFEDYDGSDFSNRSVYRLIDVCQLSDDEFITVVNALLRK